MDIEETMMMMLDEVEETTSNVVAEEDLEEDIYFSAGRLNGDFCWYAVKNDTKPLSPVFPDLPPNYSYSYGSASVALGSVLYVLGGENPKFWDPLCIQRYFDQVYCIDTLCPEKGWTKCPCMSRPRVSAKAFTHDGKVYVAGGVIGNHSIEDIPCEKDGLWYLPSDNYFEVFDPSEPEESRCWRQAFSTEIPQEVRLFYIDAVQMLQNSTSRAWELMVLLTGLRISVLYKYNLDDKSWTCLSGDVPFYRPRNVLYNDTVLYWYDRMQSLDHILCLDVNNESDGPRPLNFSEREPCKGTLYFCTGGEEEKEDLDCVGCQFCYSTPRIFLHLSGGTKFCLLCEDHCTPSEALPPDGECPLVVSCLKFSVSKKPNSKGGFDFLASLLTKSTHFVFADEMLDAIAIPSVQGQRGANGAEEGTWGSSDSSNRAKRMKTM